MVGILICTKLFPSTRRACSSARTFMHVALNGCADDACGGKEVDLYAIGFA